MGGRASRLHQVLNATLECGGKILVILDDVWKLFLLKEVGIPFGDNHKGCKIVLTSRRKDVCDEMGSQ